jgi:putative intracellular protease/amidase
MKALENTMALHEINRDRYDALYLPGGHGTMWDFPVSTPLADIVSEMHARGKVVAAVCHGPAGLIHAKNTQDDESLVKGKRVNCFTDKEERLVEKDDAVPFLLESKLRQLGASFQHARPMDAHVAVDGNLITGQNPASAQPLAQAVIETIKRNRKNMAA